MLAFKSAQLSLAVSSTCCGGCSGPAQAPGAAGTMPGWRRQSWRWRWRGQSRLQVGMVLASVQVMLLPAFQGHTSTCCTSGRAAGACCLLTCSAAGHEYHLHTAMPHCSTCLQLLGCSRHALMPAAKGMPISRSHVDAPWRHVQLVTIAALAGSIDTVGTTGRVALVPNLVNSVPRQATLEIDVRDTDGARRDRVVAAIRSAVEAIAKGRGVQHSSELVNQDPPATCSDQVLPTPCPEETLS